jgi:hypothetical protein
MGTQASITTDAGGTEYDIDIDVTGLEGTVQQVKAETYNDTGTSRWVKLFYAVGIAYEA